MSHSAGCFLTFLILPLDTHKFLILMKSNLFTFYLCVFGALSKKSSPNSRSKVLFLGPARWRKRLSARALLRRPGVRWFGFWAGTDAPLVKPCCGGVPHKVEEDNGC